MRGRASCSRFSSNSNKEKGVMTRLRVGSLGPKQQRPPRLKRVREGEGLQRELERGRGDAGEITIRCIGGLSSRASVSKLKMRRRRVTKGEKEEEVCQGTDVSFWNVNFSLFLSLSLSLSLCLSDPPSPSARFTRALPLRYEQGSGKSQARRRGA